MLNTGKTFLKINPKWQVLIWDYKKTGYLVSVQTAISQKISLSLALILRQMTGTTPYETIINQISSQFNISTEEACGLLEEIIETLKEMNIIQMSSTPFLSRTFPLPVITPYRLMILQIQLTNCCNLRCLHCYAASEANADRGLPYKQIIQLIDQFASLGGIRLFLTGGEPLLRPDLEDIVAYAKSRHLFVYLSTNGFAVTQQKAEKLVRLGVGAVNFSLDGADAVTHDTFRQTPGSFNRTLNGIESFLSQNIPCAVQTTVHKNNLKQCAKIENMLRPKGVSACYFVKMMPQGRANENLQLIPTMDEYKNSLFEEYSNLHLNYGEMVYPKITDGLKPSTRCSAGTSQLYIRADGSCFPCPSLVTDFLFLGRYPQKSLGKIWEQATGPLTDIRNFDALSIQECQGCEHQLICKGGCAGNALHYHGDWTKADPHVCLAMSVRKSVDLIPIPLEYNCSSPI
ncbi:MAG: radical SAM protein [Clostridia bacterium]|nr:radical SAM protein [Clostridia bacterium]